MNNSSLLEIWKIAAKDLGLEIVTPFVISLENEIVEADFLVRYFGAPQGTIVVTNYSQIINKTENLVSLGYGYSVLSEPSCGNTSQYCREDFIEMLNEWGWCGDETQKPTWLEET